MRYVRRLIAILTGCATWFLVAATAAYAQVPPDPVGGSGGTVIPPPSTTAAETPVWQTVALVTLGILLVLAVVGLFYSLWQRRSERSRTSEPSRRQHRLHI